MGYWPSLVNPNRENLFEKNGIDSCFLLYNDWNKVDGWYAKPFKELWKLRFYESPFVYDQMGWSQGQYRPSVPQTTILRNEYGVNNVMNEYFYGDTLFKLLRNIQDPSWVSAYKAGISIDTTSGP